MRGSLLVCETNCIRQPNRQQPSSSYNHNTRTDLQTSVLLVAISPVFFSNLHNAVQHVRSSRHMKVGRLLKLCSSFLSAKINIFDSASHADLAMLQQYVPILVKFLHAATKGGVEIPSDIVSELVTHSLDVCRAPYSYYLFVVDHFH